MSAKKTILILCDWFLPGYLAGGPIQSISNLTKQLSNDVSFKIITTDRDFKSLNSYDNVKTNCWTSFEDRDVFYISPENLNAEYILNIVKQTPHDVMYLNSLFSKLFTIAPLTWKKKKIITSQIILAPRGMLGDGALAIKPIKKKIFLVYAKLIGLFKNVHWQSTSAQETIEIKKRIGVKTSITEISNLPNTINGTRPLQKKVGELKLCFISRISEKKNLNFVIDVLKKISNYSITIDVFGPIEDEVYWQLCLSNAKLLTANVTFTYKGTLMPAQIGNTLCNYHALFLPTKNENYGHIIVESLQHARPVILSNQTPWRNLLNINIGVDIALEDKSKFVEALIMYCNIDQYDFDLKCKACQSYINTALNIDNIKMKYIDLFNNSIIKNSY